MTKNEQIAQVMGWRGNVVGFIGYLQNNNHGQLWLAKKLQQRMVDECTNRTSRHR